MPTSRAGLVIVVVVLAASAAAFGAPSEAPRLSAVGLDPLQEPPAPGRAIVLRGLNLPDRQAAAEMEEFDVFAPNAIIEERAGSNVKKLPRPTVRFFRGTLDDDPDSLVFLAVKPKDVSGYITSRGRNLRIRSLARVKPSLVKSVGDLSLVIEDVPVPEERDPDDLWSCDLDAYPIDLTLSPRQSIASAMSVRADSLPAGSTTASYVLNLAILGDVELYALQTSNTSTYIASLVAGVSLIYKRDLQTDLRIVYSGHFTAEPDPFSFSTDTLSALLELGGYWHDTPALAAISRSAVMLVSGKNVGAGIAWRTAMCSPVSADNARNDTGLVANGRDGAYGLLMKAGGSTDFDPNDLTNYYADSDRFGFEYWPMLAFAHELGHIVQSPHTHCIALTAGEKTTYGVTRNYVDECYSGEGGCYEDGVDPAGQYAVNANLPAERGSIMSYCHLTTGNPIGYGAATRYLFGQAGEPTAKVVDAMKAALSSATPALSSTITAPASVTTGVAANASIPLPANVSYQWVVNEPNAVINSGGSGSTGGGGGTSTVNFTGITSPAKLRIYVTNSSGCSASEYVSIPVNSSCTPPSITGQPASAIFIDGVGALLSVTATGTPTLTYQWYVGESGDTSTPAASGSSISANPKATTKYWARVSNSCGSADSSTATLTVLKKRSDFDGDRDSDLVWRNDSTGAVSIWLMSGASLVGGGAPSPGNIGTSWRIAAVADFDGDRKADLLWRNSSTGVNSIWFMNGINWVGGGRPGDVADLAWSVVGTGDFNADGKADIVWRNSTTGAVSIWLMNGALLTGGGAPSPGNLGTSWTIAGIGDFNGDGKSDLLWRNATTGANSIWFMNGTAWIGGGRPGDVSEAGWSVAGTGDFQGDGKADIVWRNSTTGALSIWLMNGAVLTGGGAPSAGNLGTSWSPDAIGDFNMDGKSDLLWRNASTGVNSIWFMNGTSWIGGGRPGDIADTNWKAVAPR